MKILVLSNGPVMLETIIRFAECSTIHFDVLSSPVECKIPNNISIIEIDDINHNCARIPGIPDMIKYATKNHKYYDLVVTFSNYVQNQQAFFSLLGNKLFCPDSSCSFLEDDKLQTKQLLNELNIPTPKYTIIDKNNILEKLDNISLPIVFKLSKTDWKIGSFGSNVFTDRNYTETIKKLLYYCNDDQIFYTEDYIKGKEVSMHFLCKDTSWTYLGSARDYKKIHENDTGINTGSVGCYSPVEFLTDAIENIVFEYMDKIVNELNSKRIYYKGIMYIGVIIDGEDNIPKILEINTRPGNPEFLTIGKLLDQEKLLDNFIKSSKDEKMHDIIIDKSLSSVAVTVHRTKFDIEAKNIYEIYYEKTIFPVFDNIPDDLKILYSDPNNIVTKNIFCTIIATDITRQKAADKIYQWLYTQNLKTFTFRKDIGIYE